MADLRAMMAELGYSDVRTVLNGGNIVFAAPVAETAGAGRRIADAIAAWLGVSAAVIVLSAQQLAEIAAADPLVAVADDPARLLVAFVSCPEDVDVLAPLLDRDWSPESLALGESRLPLVPRRSRVQSRRTGGRP
jgi:uncharacterized protein (DUF1697 family)